MPLAAACWYALLFVSCWLHASKVGVLATKFNAGALSVVIVMLRFAINPHMFDIKHYWYDVTSLGMAVAPCVSFDRCCKAASRTRQSCNINPWFWSRRLSVLICSFACASSTRFNSPSQWWNKMLLGVVDGSPDLTTVVYFPVIRLMVLSVRIWIELLYRTFGIMTLWR